jgi:L-2-hydroxyglutarate oxidase
MNEQADVVIVGGGIIGLATARAVQHRRPDFVVMVVDKEPQVAAHQSGHNSGVVHAGLYYAPGSTKAELCRLGRDELLAWCDRHGVLWERCGKVVVATTPDEVERLAALAERARRNGIEVTALDRVGLRDHEPHADGLAALHVPATAIVDYRAVCRVLAHQVESRGGQVVLGAPVTAIDHAGPDLVVHTGRGAVRTPRLANCAGLASDRVARLAGDDPAASILPFRGEYHELAPSRRHLVRGLIYPVPDPRFPFLGVHLTRMIDGGVHAGPNAVLALAREGYRWRDVKLGDVGSMIGTASTWRLARRHWRTGMGEVGRSLSRRRLLAALQRLVPDLRLDDLVPAGSGVRAQAVAPDGTLLDDFAFAGGNTPGGARTVHVVNAPSPAATASFAIGGVVAGHLLD